MRRGRLRALLCAVALTAGWLVTGGQGVVSDAGDGNALDHADWADAKLTCGGGV